MSRSASNRAVVSMVSGTAGRSSSMESIWRWFEAFEDGDTNGVKDAHH
ncbi:MAG: hypothetical protein ABR499_04450 [Gemmatimonadaceae bacterium]